jgi:proteasome lid subunit RPN8/RPN11
VEGTETTVVANDKVNAYMAQLSEAIEATRSDRLIGWYHSHPFDVAAHSNANLSNTDVQTQKSWQISEDRAGNPWLALVVDPLRGVAKGRPEIGAFRCYAESYMPPRNQAPDGEQLSLELRAGAESHLAVCVRRLSCCAPSLSHLSSPPLPPLSLSHPLPLSLCASQAPCGAMSLP